MTASGRANLTHLCSLADYLAAIASEAGHRRALFDLMSVEPTLTFSDHLAFGAHFAMALSRLERVASVVSERERRGTSERAAQKHGLVFRTFTNLSEARSWLLAEDLAP